MAEKLPAFDANLARIMRRKGVSADAVPTHERWLDFLAAINSCLIGYETNRSLLDESAKLSSTRLRQLYEELRRESSLRLAEIERHRSELEAEVNERTADLSAAQTELYKINARLHYDATHDNLTGVRNRAYFMQELERRFAFCSKVGGSDESATTGLAVFFVDLDRFKGVNDSLGHDVGDEVLVTAARRLESVLRDDDCLARVGGDEFCILVDLDGDVDHEELADVLASQFDSPFECGGLLIPIRGSVGAAIARSHHESGGMLLRDSDIAMYRAKDQQSPFVVFNQSLFDDLQESLELEHDLNQAVAERAFFINFEPIVDIHTGQVRATESLARWNHPTRGVLAPTRFIPIAQEVGLLAAIDRLIFEETCRELRGWIDKGLVLDDYGINTNFSRSQLDRSDAVAFMTATTREYDIDPQRVSLEILESHLVEDSGQASATIHQLSELGFKIFIDDFGTGYSSLSYLSKYPIDGIKIDRSFVRDAAEKSENRELIRSIVAMANALRVQVVIEGVETMGQLELVRSLGCHLVQGFVFTKPMQSARAEEFLRESSHLDVLSTLDGQMRLQVPD